MTSSPPVSSDAPAAGAPLATGEDEISLLDIVETIAENIRTLIIGPIVVGVLALGAAFLITPSFTARTLVMPPQAQQSLTSSLVASLGALSGAASAVAALKNPNDQIVALLKSRTIADRMIDRFDLVKRYEKKRRDDTRKELASRTRINSGKDGLISIEIDDHDAKVSAEIANAYVQELSKLLGSLAITEAQQRRVFFERQLNSAKDQLTKAEIALKTGGIESDIFKSSPQAAVTAVAQIQAQISVQEVKLGAMRGYLTESAPEFKQALVELQALRAQLAKIESTDKTASAQSGTTPPVADYITRFREFKYYETLFELFAKQYEIARVDESREGAIIQIVDPALVPEWKSSPKRALIAAIAAVAAGLVLLLWAFVRKGLANATKDEKTSQRLQRVRALLTWKRVPLV